MSRQLLQSPAFGRDLRRWLKLHPETAADIEATLVKLSADPGDPTLRTHKLKGTLAGCWACSAGYDVRIVFEYEVRGQTEAILLVTLGTHDEVY